MDQNRNKPGYTGSVIDMHSHLLPNLDDGPQSFVQSLNMLKIAAGEGTAAIVATPHLVCDGSERQYILRAKECVAQIREMADQAGIRIKVLLGFELLLSPLIQHAQDIRSMLIEGSEKMLVELSASDPRDVLDELVYETGHYGIGLILAHPERSKWLGSNRPYLNELLRGGVMLQVNSDSITGAWGRSACRFARRLAEDGQIHFIGSDAHSDIHRGPHVREALSILKGWVGEDAALRIAFGNAEALFAR